MVLGTHVPSELFELVLPSVESLLPCRVTRFLISTAMPVSVLRRMVLRSFFVPPSGGGVRRQVPAVSDILSAA